MLDEGEQRLGATVPYAEDEARKADWRMMREELIKLVVRLPRNFDQMIAKTGMARGGQNMQAVEQQLAVDRQEMDALAEFACERVNRRCQRLEEPLLIATQGGEPLLVDMVATLPPAERWSYVFEGNGQALDHILLDAESAVRGTFTVFHVNAGGEGKASDHDPLLLRLQIP